MYKVIDTTNGKESIFFSIEDAMNYTIQVNKQAGYGRYQLVNL